METRSRINRVFIWALVLAALTYGTRQAVAGTRDSGCPFDPPAFLGDCPAGGSSECNMMCQSYGKEWSGFCTMTDCCVCFL